MSMVINPHWRQFCCPTCGRVISDCRIGPIQPDTLPTVEFIESCAVCRSTKPTPSTPPTTR